MAINNHYGQSVAIYGSNALSGAPYVSAFIETYYNNGGSWVNAQLTGASLGYGTSVAVATDWAVVGSPQENGNRGTVYIYRRNGSSWAQYKNAIQDPNDQADDLFGCAVALSANYCIIGAKGQGASGEGAVYVYKLN